MRVLSLFSGVGGFDLGLEAAGMTTVFQCEIDKHARTVLDHRWPDVPKWDDVTTLTGAHILEQTGGVDVVAWGSPCQDLSLAGKRAGLSGERSGLFHQGIRIIKELRELSNGKYPTWSVWENVVGALSSNRGADFGEVLHEMDEAGACFSEWTVLDAQYFGVPQRRRRVFVTSCFDSRTAAQCPDKIFPVAQSLPRDSSTGNEPGEGSSGTVAESVGSSSEPNNKRPIIFSPGAMSRLGGHMWDDGSAPTLLAKPGDNFPAVGQEPAHFDGSTVSPTLRGFGHGWQGQQNSTHGIAQPIQALSYDGYNQTVEEEIHRPIRVGRDSPDFVADLRPPTMVVRRLTPLECERLMGWPDNHTAVATNGPVSDTQRYKMCGNGVASPVAQWIAAHLMNLQ